MSDLLALEWEQEHVCGVLAHVAGGQVRIKRCFAIKKPAELDPAVPAVAGPWLKEQLSQLQIRADAAIITLPRDAAIVRRLDLPEAPDDELPLLVRFQAGSKTSLALNESALDFIPLPRTAGAEGRQVLMAAIPRKTIEGLRTACQAAGLKLASVGLSPLTVMELISRLSQPAANTVGGANLVLSRHGDRVEVSVAEGNHLVTSHSFRLSAETLEQEQQQIVSEVSRALIAISSGARIEHGWMLIDTAHRGTLAAVLGQRLDCEVRPIDPFSGVDWEGSPQLPADPSSFAGPVGALLSKSGARAPTLDFLNPRQPPVKRDQRKVRLALLAGAIGVGAILVGAYYWIEIRRLDKSIAAQLDQEGKLATLVNKGDKNLKSAESIERWLGSGTVWLDELLDFTQHMPGTDRIFLTSLAVELPQNVSLMGITTSAPYVGKLNAEGVARERQDAMDLNARWVDYERYNVVPKETTQDKGNEAYPWKFQSEIFLRKTAPKPTPKPAAAADAKPGATPDASAKPADSGEKKPEESTAEKSDAPPDGERRRWGGGRGRWPGGGRPGGGGGFGGGARRRARPPEDGEAPAGESAPATTEPDKAAESQPQSAEPAAESKVAP